MKSPPDALRRGPASAGCLSVYPQTGSPHLILEGEAEAKREGCCPLGEVAEKQPLLCPWHFCSAQNEPQVPSFTRVI